MFKIQKTKNLGSREYYYEGACKNQEASSIGNTQKLRKLRMMSEASDKDHPYSYYDKNLGSKSQILQGHIIRTRRNFDTAIRSFRRG